MVPVACDMWAWLMAKPICEPSIRNCPDESLQQYEDASPHGIRKLQCCTEHGLYCVKPLFLCKVGLFVYRSVCIPLHSLPGSVERHQPGDPLDDSASHAVLGWV